MKYSQMSTVERMIQSACCAVRCRAEAAKDTCDHETRVALIRAANRYSGRVEDLAGELLAERR